MRVTKDLVAASATPMVLGILAESESYGYAILRRINELSGGELDWTEGLLYPLLHRLERLGYVEASWQAVAGERRRKYYRITNAGVAELTEQRRQWDTIIGTLKEIWPGGGDYRSLIAIPVGGPGMTAADGHDELEAQLAQWRQYVQRRRELKKADADELEDHLRGSVDELIGVGLRPDEAFLVAVKRMGSLDDLSREFAREHSERLWKQLVLTGDPDNTVADGRSRRDLFAMVICAAGAIVSIKVPALFGLSFKDDGAFYAVNASLFAMPWLAAFLGWRRRVKPALIAVLVGLFVLGAVGANVYPLGDESQSLVLSSVHLGIALWLVVGLSYVGSEWNSSRRRMDFIRFTGEWFVYFVLIGLGGGVLTGFTVGTFNAIGVSPETFVSQWLLPCGVVAAVVVAGWLVEAKQGVVENIAPVLTRLFTPLFTAVLLAFLVGVIWTSAGIDIERDALILFNLLLVVVLGLLLYSLSARDPLAPPGLFDRLQFALVVSALAIDVLVLVEITGRISDYGTTPNKAAALGANLILLANLAWSAWLILEFVRRRTPFARLERWQTGYLPVYAVWAWAVVLIFPPVFGYL